MINNSVKNDISMLEPVFARHADEYGSLIAILQEAQDIYGYLPDDVLAAISERTGRSPPTSGELRLFTRSSASHPSENI